MRSSDLQRVAHDRRAPRGRDRDQCANPWHTWRPPASGALSVYFSAKRACPDSCPGSARLALQAASESAGRLNSATSVTVALPGIVAHSVTAFASASVHAPAGGTASPAAADTVVARRGSDQQCRPTRGHGRHHGDAVRAYPAQHAVLDLGTRAAAGELELTGGAADLGDACLQLMLHHALRRPLAVGEPLRQRKARHRRRTDDDEQDDQLQALLAA